MSKLRMIKRRKVRPLLRYTTVLQKFYWVILET